MPAKRQRIDVRIDTAEDTSIRILDEKSRTIMGRFARVTEEVLLRHKELAVEHHKTRKLGRNALETLYLYICILTHSWATGFLEKKKFKELCEIYGLNIDNSYRRLKVLRKKGWIEDTKAIIRPILIHNAKESKTVIITDKPTEKTVTITAEPKTKTVTVTAENCNSYSKSDTKTVTVTAENAETPYEQTDSGDAKISLNLKTDFMNTTHGENAAGGRVENGKIHSKFSLSECLRYATICQTNGDDIRNPRALAVSLHQSGNADAFIEATLYPERLRDFSQNSSEQKFDGDGKFIPQPLSNQQREYYLNNLSSFSDDEFDEAEWKDFFTPTDWAWLKGELQR